MPDTTSGFSHGLLHQISLAGASGMAPFYLALTRAIDALEMLPEVDRARIGVSGLSGGAWQAIWLAALDPRIALANTVAGFSPLATCMEFYEDIGDFEELPVDMGSVGDFTHLAAMVAPRPLLLVNNPLRQLLLRCRPRAAASLRGGAARLSSAWGGRLAANVREL